MVICNVTELSIDIDSMQCMVLMMYCNDEYYYVISVVIIISYVECEL